MEERGKKITKALSRLRGRFHFVQHAAVTTMGFRGVATHPLPVLRNSAVLRRTNFTDVSPNH